MNQLVTKCVLDDDDYDELINELDSIEARELFRNFHVRESDDLS